MKRDLESTELEVLDLGELEEVQGGILPLIAAAGAAWVGSNVAQLVSTYAGWSTPDPSGRLGLVAATANSEWGTVGAAVNVSAAALYAVLGPVGEQQIGSFFAQPENAALLSQPLNSPASQQAAAAELGYWQSQEGTLGGALGSMVGVEARDAIQQVLGDPVTAISNAATNAYNAVFGETPAAQAAEGAQPADAPADPAHAAEPGNEPGSEQHADDPAAPDHAGDAPTEHVGDPAPGEQTIENAPEHDAPTDGDPAPTEHTIENAPEHDAPTYDDPAAGEHTIENGDGGFAVEGTDHSNDTGFGADGTDHSNDSGFDHTADGVGYGSTDASSAAEHSADAGGSYGSDAGSTGGESADSGGGSYGGDAGGGSDSGSGGGSDSGSGGGYDGGGGGYDGGGGGGGDYGGGGE